MQAQYVKAREMVDEIDPPYKRFAMDERKNERIFDEFIGERDRIDKNNLVGSCIITRRRRRSPNVIKTKRSRDTRGHFESFSTDNLTNTSSTQNSP